MPDYIWHPIDDLPVDWPSLASQELRTLPESWQAQRAKLVAAGELQRFHAQFEERLDREWAIETGAIEGVYAIDRGTTQTLIEHGIKASLMPHGSVNRPAQWVAEVVNTQKAALEGLFAFVKQDRQLSVGYVRELHGALLCGIDSYDTLDPSGHWVKAPLRAGEWKTLPNNVRAADGSMHEYCPPVHVAAEMDRLVAMHLAHPGIPVEVESAWLHHRFTQIHPFQDGNGRAARALASLIAIRAGCFPLVIRRSDQAEYIEALERADQGDLGPLVRLFAHQHAETLQQAIGVSSTLLPGAT